MRALKRRILTEVFDLDDFEALAHLVHVLPLSFEKSELDTFRETYSEFAGKYAAECDLNDPDELRDEASRIGNVGELFKVDTAEAQDMLSESAKRIEEEEESRWDGDESRTSSDGSSEVCSDIELDAMFGTLGS